MYESYESDLVELFEFKVAALRSGRLSKGSQATLRNLREYLLELPLESKLLRRVRQTDRVWREWQKGQLGAVQAVGALAPAEAAQVATELPVFTPEDGSDEQESSGLSLFGAEFGAALERELQGSVALQGSGTPQRERGAASMAPSRNEWEVLRNLRSALFYFDLHLRAQAQAQVWVSNRQQAPLRLALALLQAWQEIYPHALLPTVNIHYSDLRQPDKAGQVLGLLAQHLSLPLDTGQLQQQRMRGALRAVQGSPLPPAALGIKPLKDEERDQEALQRALHKLLVYSAQGENPIAPTATGQAILSSAVQQLLSFLEKVLPHSLGGRGPELALLGGLLYARAQAMRVTTPDNQSLSLAIHLPGGDQAQWCGTALRWRRLGEDGWEVVVNDPQRGEDFVRLSSAQPLAQSYLAGERLRLALLGDDLALERRPVNHLDLAPLAQEARLCAALLESDGHYVNLRLARAVAMYLRGGASAEAIVPEKVAPASADAYASAPAADLLAFARQGVQVLRAAAGQAQPQQLSEAFAHAQLAVQAAPETAQALLDLLLTDPAQWRLPALDDYSALSVSDAQTHAVLLFRGEPLSVRVMNQPLTLRNDDQGRLLALLPGRPTAQVGELLALPLPRGAVVLVRAGERVALGFQPKLPHPVSP